MLIISREWPAWSYPVGKRRNKNWPTSGSLSSKNGIEVSPSTHVSSSKKSVCNVSTVPPPKKSMNWEPRLEKVAPSTRDTRSSAPSSMTSQKAMKSQIIMRYGTLEPTFTHSVPITELCRALCTPMLVEAKGKPAKDPAANEERIGHVGGYIKRVGDMAISGCDSEVELKVVLEQGEQAKLEEVCALKEQDPVDQLVLAAFVDEEEEQHPHHCRDAEGRNEEDHQKDRKRLLHYIPDRLVGREECVQHAGAQSAQYVGTKGRRRRPGGEVKQCLMLRAVVVASVVLHPVVPHCVDYLFPQHLPALFYPRLHGLRHPWVQINGVLDDGSNHSVDVTLKSVEAPLGDKVLHPVPRTHASRVRLAVVHRPPRLEWICPWDALRALHLETCGVTNSGTLGQTPQSNVQYDPYGRYTSAGKRHDSSSVVATPITRIKRALAAHPNADFART
eukprot:scaffold61921_cov69-Phaeocystis_antarctica.AAC.7